MESWVARAMMNDLAGVWSAFVRIWHEDMKLGIVIYQYHLIYLTARSFTALLYSSILFLCSSRSP